MWLVFWDRNFPKMHKSRDWKSHRTKKNLSYFIFFKTRGFIQLNKHTQKGMGLKFLGFSGNPKKILNSKSWNCNRIPGKPRNFSISWLFGDVYLRVIQKWNGKGFFRRIRCFRSLPVPIPNRIRGYIRVNLVYLKNMTFDKFSNCALTFIIFGRGFAPSANGFFPSFILSQPP